MLGAYFVGLTVFLVARSGWTTPDLYFPGLFVIALVIGRGRRFLRDWVPFLGLLIAYESLRSVADEVNQRVHWLGVINADQFLGFGRTPTEHLQHLLYEPGLNTLNFVVSIAYLMHFVIPVAFAFGLWWLDSRGYWRFVATMLLVSFAGFLTFLAFPVAPPWMAMQEGLLPPFARVVPDALSEIVDTHVVSLVWSKVTSNPVAAFPSLHAAWPLLVALTIVRRWGSRWRWRAFSYPAFIGFLIVYSGEHYLVDVLSGYAYGLAAFATVEWLAWRAATGREGQTSRSATLAADRPAGTGRGQGFS